MGAWEQKNYEMNKCLSLVHLTRRAMYFIENNHMVLGRELNPGRQPFQCYVML